MPQNTGFLDRPGFHSEKHPADPNMIWYRIPMNERAVPKSVTLPPDLIKEVEELAGKRGFSSATVQALSHWVARKRFRAALEEHEAIEGEITAEEMSEAIARLGGL